MFEENVIIEPLVVSFYKEYDLIPGHRSVIDQEEFLKITFSALDRSIAFGKFVLESIVPIAHNEYVLNFQTWDDLIECYYTFITGFVGNKS